MHEIEAKIRVEDFETVIGRLNAASAVFLRRVYETDVYLDVNGTLKEKGCGLRIRRQLMEKVEKTFITYKGAKVPSRYKSRPEYETEVADADTVEQIFAQLGFTSLITVEKKRALWELDDCTVCLDEVLGLGCFVEVEGIDEDGIESVLKKLDIANKPHIHIGYASMLSKIKDETRF